MTTATLTGDSSTTYLYVSTTIATPPPNPKHGPCSSATTHPKTFKGARIDTMALSLLHRAASAGPLPLRALPWGFLAAAAPAGGFTVETAGTPSSCGAMAVGAVLTMSATVTALVDSHSL